MFNFRWSFANQIREHGETSRKKGLWHIRYFLEQWYIKVYLFLRNAKRFDYFFWDNKNYHWCTSIIMCLKCSLYGNVCWPAIYAVAWSHAHVEMRGQYFNMNASATSNPHIRHSSCLLFFPPSPGGGERKIKWNVHYLYWHFGVSSPMSLLFLIAKAKA